VGSLLHAGSEQVEGADLAYKEIYLFNQPAEVNIVTQINRLMVAPIIPSTLRMITAIMHLE
jgi:hypothetical protein